MVERERREGRRRRGEGDGSKRDEGERIETGGSAGEGEWEGRWKRGV